VPSVATPSRAATGIPSRSTSGAPPSSSSAPSTASGATSSTGRPTLPPPNGGVAGAGLPDPVVGAASGPDGRCRLRIGRPVPPPGSNRRFALRAPYRSRSPGLRRLAPARCSRSPGLSTPGSTPFGARSPPRARRSSASEGQGERAPRTPSTSPACDAVTRTAENGALRASNGEASPEPASSRLIAGTHLGGTLP